MKRLGACCTSPSGCNFGFLAATASDFAKSPQRSAVATPAGFLLTRLVSLKNPKFRYRQDSCNRLLAWFFCVPLVLLVSLSLSAEIKKGDLGKKVELTEEAVLLQQVDTVSLYLSSDRVAFAPRFTKDRVIEVETTLLDPALAASAGAKNSYVSRLIDAFVSVVKERLPDYAPSIAKNFDYQKDISFVVNSGAARIPVGVWRNGVWMASAAGAPVVSSPDFAAAEINETRAVEAESKPQTPGRKGCNCPARK